MEQLGEENKESRNSCICGNIIYYRGGMLNHNSSSAVVGQLGTHMGKKVGFTPHSIYRKLIPDDIKDLN